MKESFTRKDLWDMAAKGGLVLGAIPAVYLLYQQFLMEGLVEVAGNIPARIIDIVLWAAKTFGCLVLMRFYMRKFAETYEAVTHRDACNLGIAVAVTSALVYSGLYLAFMEYIRPEMFNQVIDNVLETYAPILDSNSRDAMESLRDSMPAVTFFSTLIYCFIYGTVLSTILSHSIGVDSNPFSTKNTTEDE